MAKKTVCDFCGMDASEEEYIVPLKNTYYAENLGVKLMAFDRMEATTVNLCDSCFITIGNTLSNRRDHFKKKYNKV